MSKSRQVAEALATASSRAEARNALAAINPSRTDLIEAANSLSTRNTGNKTEITTSLVNGTVGAREDAAAIRSDGWTR